MNFDPANPSLTVLSHAPVARADPRTGDLQKSDLQKAGEGFEALFLTLLLKGGRAGLPGDDLTGSAAVRSGMDMLDARLAQDAAGRAGLGIAEAVARQFAGNGTRP
jgi:flagellar protein FlgJ